MSENTRVPPPPAPGCHLTQRTYCLPGRPTSCSQVGLRETGTGSGPPLQSKKALPRKGDSGGTPRRKLWSPLPQAGHTEAFLWLTGADRGEGVQGSLQGGPQATAPARRGE